MQMKDWLCRWSTIPLSKILGLTVVLLGGGMLKKGPSHVVSRVFGWHPCATLARDICTGLGAPERGLERALKVSLLFVVHGWEQLGGTKVDLAHLEHPQPGTGQCAAGTGSLCQILVPWESGRGETWSKQVLRAEVSLKGKAGGG